MTRAASAASPQPGILKPIPTASRQLTLRLAPDAHAPAIRSRLLALSVDESLVVGLGAPSAAALKLKVPALRPFPALTGAGIGVPSTQAALWCWLRGTDQGELVHRSRALVERLAPVFHIDEILDTFQYAEGRDLSGYIDGTENPKGKKATTAALSPEGSSFVAVQKWTHDLDGFMAFKPAERDRIIGRRHKDNVEMSDAPESAHVKRTAQESFEPPAFILRRSMPWSSGLESGLQFLAFGHSLDAFEALLRRMIGAEDGVVDGLFRFSRPVTGGYYWCPPCKGGRLHF